MAREDKATVVQNGLPNHSPSVSEQLIEICSAPVSITSRARAALHFLDWLGCIFSGATTEAGRGMGSYSQLGQLAPGESFVCGQSSLDASGAAFVNGSLGNILEMDDVHRASILHAGDIIIPAVLATAQERNTSMQSMLDSIVRGYEMALRLGALAASGGYSNWYNSGTCGIFGAALGAASVMRLDKDQQKDCLGQAGMLGSGIWQCRFEQTWSKQLASANAARNGVVSATLGEQRFPGARHIFEGEAGFFPTYYPAANIKHLNLEPVDTWLLHEVSFKPWPACRHNHPAIEAALSIRNEHSAERIETINIDTYRAAIDFCDNADPATDHEARFSLQHCVAVALLRGEPAISDFDAAARNDPALVNLRRKISLKVGGRYESQFPAQMGSSIDVILPDGKHLKTEVESARGDPENPMSLDDITLKFHRLVAVAGVSRKNADRLVAVLLQKDRNETDSSATSIQDLNEALSATVIDMQKQHRQ